MKNLFLCFLINISCVVGFAQSNTRLNDYWENTYNINPASINNQYLTIYSLATRAQWIGFPGSPKTFFASANTYLDNNHAQVGLQLYEEKIGYTFTSNIGLSYAYATQLTSEWKMNLALAGKFENQNYNADDVISAQDNDTEVFKQLSNENNLNVDMGFEFMNRSLRIGAAGKNIFSMFAPTLSKQSYSNFFYAMYRKETDDFINLGIGLCGIQYSAFSQMEMNVSAYFRKNGIKDILQVGFLYRSKDEVGGLLGLNLNSNIRISYSYDFNSSNINRRSVGSHELTFIYRINKCPTCY